MKSIIFSLFVALGSCQSYWDSNNCDDVYLEYPEETSTAIVYMLGDEEQQTKFTYNLFKSELGPGTAV